MWNGAEQTAYPSEMLSKQAMELSLKTKLKMAVERAEMQLKDAQRAAEILEKNPELEELINIMQRQRYL